MSSEGTNDNTGVNAANGGPAAPDKVALTDREMDILQKVWTCFKSVPEVSDVLSLASTKLLSNAFIPYIHPPRETMVISPRCCGESSFTLTIGAISTVSGSTFDTSILNTNLFLPLGGLPASCRRVRNGPSGFRLQRLV